MIAHKSEKDQAGALPGEKWLVVYLDPVYTIAAILDIEAIRKSHESWLAFELRIDRRHFEPEALSKRCGRVGQAAETTGRPPLWERLQRSSPHPAKLTSYHLPSAAAGSRTLVVISDTLG